MSKRPNKERIKKNIKELKLGTVLSNTAKWYSVILNNETTSKKP